MRGKGGVGGVKMCTRRGLRRDRGERQRQRSSAPFYRGGRRQEEGIGGLDRWPRGGSDGGGTSAGDRQAARSDPDSGRRGWHHAVGGH
jgi:hypothetical protein